MFVFPAPYTADAPVLTGAHVVSGTNGTTLSIGAEPTGDERRFIVVAGTATGSAPVIGGSPTIGGAAATQVVSNDAGNEGTNIFYLEVPTGTTAAIESDLQSASFVRVHVYRLIVTNGGGLAVTDFASDDDLVSTLNFALDIAAGGFVVAGIQGQNCGPWTWTGLDEDDDTDQLSNEYASAASRAFVGAETAYAITAECTANSDDIQGVVASFAPTAS